MQGANVDDVVLLAVGDGGGGGGVDEAACLRGHFIFSTYWPLAIWWLLALSLAPDTTHV